MDGLEDGLLLRDDRIVRDEEVVFVAATELEAAGGKLDARRRNHDGEANDPHEARTADEDAREKMEDFLAACRIRSVVRVVAHHDDDR